MARERRVDELDRHDLMYVVLAVRVDHPGDRGLVARAQAQPSASPDLAGRRLRELPARDPERREDVLGDERIRINGAWEVVRYGLEIRASEEGHQYRLVPIS